MINAPQLLADLTRRLTLLEADLRKRIDTVPDLKASLQAKWQAARCRTHGRDLRELGRSGHHPSRGCIGC